MEVHVFKHAQQDMQQTNNHLNVKNVTQVVKPVQLQVQIPVKPAQEVFYSDLLEEDI